jgi:uncharacterized protein (DUF58 family)
VNDLLEPRDLDLVRRLDLWARRRLAGQATGEQRSPALGGGIEFADYREYVPGDDVRQVDWSVFLRFRKLLVKLCAEEKELTLMVAVDTSQSMAYGRGDKFRQARRIAGVLGGMALSSGNRAGVLAWGEQLREVTVPLRGARAVPALVERLARLETAGRGDPLTCARQFASRYRRRALAVLITDLLTPDWPAVLAGLASSGCEAHVIHVLAPEELDPPQRGELTLVDQETGQETALHVDAPTLERYRAETAAWLAKVEAQARGAGLGYARVVSDEALPRVFLETLRKEGLVC